MKKHFLGALAVVFAASLWGFDGVVLRPNLYHLSVPLVVFMEHAVAFCLMMTFVAFVWISTGRKELLEVKKLGRREWVSFFWIAVFGGAIGTMAITKALFHVSFEHLSVIIILQKLQPLFGILLALLVLRERPRPMFYLWAGLALIGSYLITFGFNEPVFSGNRLFLAALLSVVAAFSFGSSTVFGKRALNSVSFRLATYIRFGLTSLLMLAILVATGGLDAASQVTAREIMIIFIIAMTTGGTAIFIYYWGLRQVLASKATIYELGFPVTAVVLDYIVHGHIMGPGQWAGAALIVLSMLKIVQARR